MVILSINTGLPLSELLAWDRRDIATALDYLDQRSDAIKDSTKGA